MRSLARKIITVAVAATIVGAGNAAVTGALSPASAKDCQSTSSAKNAGGNVDDMPRDDGGTSTACYEKKPTAPETLPPVTKPKTPKLPKPKPPKVPTANVPATPVDTVGSTPKLVQPKTKKPKASTTPAPAAVEVIPPAEAAQPPAEQACLPTIVSEIPWWVWLLVAASVAGLGYTVFAAYKRRKDDAEQEESDESDPAAFDAANSQ